MLLSPNKAVVNKLKAYDKHLNVKWNNYGKYWEIWVRRPTGNKLVTPVVEAIYKFKGDSSGFVPLDHRIVEWIKNADGQKTTLKKGWRWLRSKAYEENREKRRQERRKLYHNMAKDAYSLIRGNQKYQLTNFGEDFLLPDIQSRCANRVYYRSAENAKEFFGDEA